MTELTTMEKITKARVNIQMGNPFFAYLSLYLNFQKDTGQLSENSLMGVNAKGDVRYKEEIGELTQEEITAVILHEVLHCAFFHLLRMDKRDKEKFNYATDLVVNNLLVNNGYHLPQGCLLPVNNCYTFRTTPHVTIKDIDKKTAEMVYEELPEFPAGKNKTYVIGKGGDGRIDDHMEGEGELGEAEQEEIKEHWAKAMEEAYTMSKQRGQTPAGIDRYIDELRTSQINWRQLLQKVVKASMPFDYSYTKRGKKSFSTGIYFPSYQKESIEVTLVIDTSGSIGREEIIDFASEMYGISKLYSGQAKFKIICHDVDVQLEYELTSKSKDDLRKLKLKGGGGTSHKPVFDHLKKKNQRDLVIFLTDGYSDLNSIDFHKYPFLKVFVISKGGTDEQLLQRSCKVIKLK